MDINKITDSVAKDLDQVVWQPFELNQGAPAGVRAFNGKGKDWSFLVIGKDQYRDATATWLGGKIMVGEWPVAFRLTPELAAKAFELATRSKP